MKKTIVQLINESDDYGTIEIGHLHLDGVVTPKQDITLNEGDK